MTGSRIRWRGGAAVGHVGDHEPLGAVGDARLVAELGRPSWAAHPDRARVGIDQRDAPVWERALPGPAQIRLRDPLPGPPELPLEPLDERDADALAARIPARAACERVRLAHRLLGTGRNLGG